MSAIVSLEEGGREGPRNLAPSAPPSWSGFPGRVGCSASGSWGGVRGSGGADGPCCPPAVCGKRYKNRPGLSYHYTHTHLAEEEGEENAERHALPFHRKNNHKREWARGPPWAGGS